MKYERYIGYCFNDWNGREVVLERIFPIYNRNTGKVADTGYVLLDVKSGAQFTYDYRTFKERVVDSTDLPR